MNVNCGDCMGQNLVVIRLETFGHVEDGTVGCETGFRIEIDLGENGESVDIVVIDVGTVVVSWEG